MSPGGTERPEDPCKELLAAVFEIGQQAKKAVFLHILDAKLAFALRVVLQLVPVENGWGTGVSVLDREERVEVEGRNRRPQNRTETVWGGRMTDWRPISVTSFGIIVVVAMLGFAGGGGAIPTGTAQSVQQTDQPTVPASFYGKVLINGEPAPSGTTIEARIENDTRGTITVDSESTYGGPAAGDQKLTIDGDANDTGKEIAFYIDADGFETGEANQTSTWEQGSITELNLTTTLVESSSNGGSSGSSGGSSSAEDGDGDDGGQIPSDTELESERVELPAPDENGVQQVTVERTSVSQLTFFTRDNLEGSNTGRLSEVTVTESPATVESAANTYAAVDIDTGDIDTSQVSGTVTMEIDVGDVSDDIDDLQMYRKATEDSGWDPLETTVEVGEGVYQVTGETPGYSTFAVAEAVEQDPSGETGTSNVGDEQSPDSTESSGGDESFLEDQAGLTITSGVLALLLSYLAVAITKRYSLR